jgi:hypothetical protein
MFDRTGSFVTNKLESKKSERQEWTVAPEYRVFAHNGAADRFKSRINARVGLSGRLRQYQHNLILAQLVFELHGALVLG